MSAVDQIRQWARAQSWIDTVAIDADIAEALCDLADAARDLLAHPMHGGAHREFRSMGYCEECGEPWDPCPTVRAARALARLDGEGQ